MCDNQSIEVHLKNVYDDRYGYPGLFSLCQCNACTHIFLDAEFSDSKLTELYSKYYPRSTFDIANYRPHQERRGFRAWLDGARASAFRWIPKNCRVLDIGCGFGETLGYHKARGCEVFGVEADDNISRVAEKHGFSVNVGLFDPANYPDAYFDYVTMDQVIEHVQNPIEVLRGVAQVLKSGGKLILSLPNAHGWGAHIFRRKWINWHVPYHMQFYSKRSMRIAIEKAGFVLEQTKTVTSSSWLYYQWLHLLTYPRNEVASVFWSRKGEYTFVQKGFFILLTYPHLMKFNHFITRAFDSVGLGDNRLYFLRKL